MLINNTLLPSLSARWGEGGFNAREVISEMLASLSTQVATAAAAARNSPVGDHPEQYFSVAELSAALGVDQPGQAAVLVGLLTCVVSTQDGGRGVATISITRNASSRRATDISVEVSATIPHSGKKWLVLEDATITANNVVTVQGTGLPQSPAFAIINSTLREV